MRLGAGISFFNDSRGLQRSLDSLKAFDVVYCIDGRYPDYDHDCDLSDDGSRELVSLYPNAVLIDYPASEPEKRNQYLRKDLDAVLIIDSDEYVTEFDRARVDAGLAEDPATNIFCIEFVNLGNQTIAPRLWQKPYEMEYVEAHNIFRKRGTGEIMRSTAGGPFIEGLTIAGDARLRTEEREHKATLYQEKLIAQEKGIKFKFGFRSSPN